MAKFQSKLDKLFSIVKLVNIESHENKKRLNAFHSP